MVASDGIDRRRQDTCVFNDLRELGGLRKFLKGRERQTYLGWNSWGTLKPRTIGLTAGMERNIHGTAIKKDPSYGLIEFHLYAAHLWGQPARTSCQAHRQISPLLAAGIFGITDEDALLQLTSYPKAFIDAIIFNMRENGVWENGSYDCSGWLSGNGAIDGETLWNHVEVACSLSVLCDFNVPALDPCQIYWNNKKLS